MSQVDDDAIFARKNGWRLRTKTGIDCSQVAHHQTELVGCIGLLDVSPLRGETGVDLDRSERNGGWSLFSRRLSAGVAAGAVEKTGAVSGGC